ncbi:hypothetical protein [Botrimarina sp.]|uniref:hypothetical protein n=1 Tax=Botrimarina sp. TaxID=2795802 RepID=UPI0032F09A41
MKRLALSLLTLAATCAPSAGQPDDQSPDLRSRIDAALAALAEVDPDQAERARAAVGPLGDDGGPPGRELQRALDRFCLLQVAINPESRVKVDTGGAPPRLTVGGPNAFLVKVENQAAVTAPLRVSSPQAVGAGAPASGGTWLRMRMHDGHSLPPELTGAPIEYRVVVLQTDQTGDRAAVVAMDVGQGTADIGFRNDVLLTFRCEKPQGASQ